MVVVVNLLDCVGSLVPSRSNILRFCFPGAVILRYESLSGLGAKAATDKLTLFSGSPVSGTGLAAK